MDDHRFDTLVRNLAARRNRRALLRGGLGIGALLGAAGSATGADAARRGFSGPKAPTPCAPNCDGSLCGDDGCGGTCVCAAGCSCFSDVLEIPVTPVCMTGFTHTDGWPFSQEECEAIEYDWSDPISGACVRTCPAS